MAPFSLDLLRTLAVTRTLSADPLAKSAVLLGTLDGQPAIVTLTRAALPSADSNDDGDGRHPLQALVSGLEGWQIRGENGIYFWGAAGTAAGEAGGLDVSVVWPATDVHIRKHETQQYRMVTETPALYATVTEPYIASLPPSRTAWVQNILDGLKEQDAILLRTPAFVLLPDSKWDLATLPSLYLTAIVADGVRLRSLRDLRGEHVPLLKGLRDEVEAFVRGRWGLDKGQLRFFIHYQPSYYHLHIHVTHLAYSSPSGGTSCERAHLLDSVIALLELDGQAYAKLPLTYALGEQHGLYAPMKAAGAIRSPLPSPTDVSLVCDYQTGPGLRLS